MNGFVFVPQTYIKMANKKILGLDLGTTSIGWSFVNLENDVPVSVKSGVRIIPLTTEERDAFNSGNAISTNAERRLKRGARKTLDRYQLRRERLKSFFKKWGWISDGTELQLLESWKIWEIRARAAAEKISLEELSLVLLHINTKRGFKSNRKSDGEEESSSEFKQAISDNDRMVLELDFTIGQWYLDELKQAQRLDSPLPQFKGKTFSRRLHKEEFDKIWSVQKQFHQDLSDDKYIILGDRTIFYQRKLKSAKHLVSKCAFYPTVRVIPASHPLFQLFRAWQEVNNLKAYHTKDGSQLDISHDIKLSIIQSLHHTVKLSSAALVKIIAKDFSLNTRQIKVSVDSILGLETPIAILKALQSVNIDRPELIDFDPFKNGNDFDKQPALQLWHQLYSIEETDDLRESLQKTFKISETVADELIKVRLRDGFGSLSARAIKKILPHLMDGLTYDKACSLAGFNHSFYLTKEENEKRVLADKINPIRRGDLRNPVVEKVMNQLVNIINSILDHPDLGRPDAIHIEMGRELTASAKQRKSMQSGLKNNATLNDKARKELEKLGLQKISRKDIIKWKLGEECNWISIYTGNPISPSEVFNSDKYDVEHIIPRSRLFDDSFSNKTLCESELNRRKGNMTGFDFMEFLGEDKLEGYLERVNYLFNNKMISKGKFEKFKMKLNEIPDDFISRQLNESQYIAREALTRLREVCFEVSPTVGMLTAHLRHEWGLDDTIKNLQLKKYKEAGLTEIRIDKGGNQIEDIKNWTKRDDHRHHALDALVVALTTRSMVQRANRLSQLMGEYSDDNQARLSRKDRIFEQPNYDIRAIASQAMGQILVSYKTGKKVATWSKNQIRTANGTLRKKQLVPRGPLHKETTLGLIKTYGQQPVELAKITDPSAIIDETARIQFEEYLNKYGNNPKITFSKKNLSKNHFVLNGQITPALNCWNRTFTKRVPITESIKIEDVVDVGIRRALEMRLQAYDGNPKKAFSNLQDDPIFLDSTKKIPIKKVTVFDKGKDLLPLRSKENGEPKDYVYTRNNHHLALYKTKEGKYHIEMVSLLEAATRKQQGLAVIRLNHPDGHEFINHFELNHYYYFGEEDVEISNLDLDLIFRVQKVSDGPNIEFRNTNETSIQRRDSFALKRIQSVQNLPKWKISYDLLGQINSIKSIEY